MRFSFDCKCRSADLRFRVKRRSRRKRAQPKSVKPNWSPLYGTIRPSWSSLYGSRSGLVKSSVQSESETARSFTFAVLEKAADGQYRHTLRGGFFQKCLKSSPRRGIYFPARQSYPYKSVIACVNVCLTTNFFRLTTSFKLFSLGQENIL